MLVFALLFGLPESNDILNRALDLLFSNAFLAELGALTPLLLVTRLLFDLLGVELSTISLGGVLNNSYGSMRLMPSPKDGVMSRGCSDSIDISILHDFLIFR